MDTVFCFIRTQQHMKMCSGTGTTFTLCSFAQSTLTLLHNYIFYRFPACASITCSTCSDDDSVASVKASVFFTNILPRFSPLAMYIGDEVGMYVVGISVGRDVGLVSSAVGPTLRGSAAVLGIQDSKYNGSCVCEFHQQVYNTLS